ncbi:MAG: hypothetical protein ACRDC0_16645, partial [Aeromonas veronii]
DFIEVTMDSMDCSAEAKQFIDQCLAARPEGECLPEATKVMAAGMDALSYAFSELLTRNVTPQELLLMIASAMDATETEHGSLLDVESKLISEMKDPAELAKPTTH